MTKEDLKTRFREVAGELNQLESHYKLIESYVSEYVDSAETASAIMGALDQQEESLTNLWNELVPFNTTNTDPEVTEEVVSTVTDLYQGYQNAQGTLKTTFQTLFDTEPEKSHFVEMIIKGYLGLN